MRKTTKPHHSAYDILDRMKGKQKARGFTVIETLIVLAITGGLFVAVALSLSGKQAQTQFDQAIQDVKSQIQQAINDVSVGYFPNRNNYTCTAGPLGPVIGSGASNQGANSGCVFLGKAVQFGISGTNPEQFRVFTIAGLQKDASGNEVTTYAAADPVVIAPSTVNPTMPDGSSGGQLNYGLTTLKAYYGSPATNIGAVAFVNSLAAYSGNGLVSGSQQLNIIPITGSALNVTSQAAATAIGAGLAASPTNPSTGVSICFVSGTTNQSGLITIGGAGRQFNVTLSIKGNKTCS